MNTDATVPGGPGAAGRPAAADLDERALDEVVRRGLITPAQGAAALEESRSRRVPLLDVLRTRGLVTEEAARDVDEETREDFIPGYRVLSKLGEGGMGVVYRALQKRLDRVVALKVVMPSLASDASYLKRFEREARAVAKLNHPNIVAAYDYGESRGRVFLAMEYVEGTNAAEWIREHGRMDEARALALTREVAAGLAHAHASGIIHRDIKPANILLAAHRPGETASGTAVGAKVTDLGLARSAGGSSELTAAGSILGTPGYMAPEQVFGNEVDHRADIYALGATLYQLLTGARPFEASTPVAVIARQQSERLPDPRDLLPELSPGIAALLQGMLAKDVSSRYPAYKPLIADIDAVRRGGMPALAAPPPGHRSLAEPAGGGARPGGTLIQPPPPSAATPATIAAPRTGSAPPPPRRTGLVAGVVVGVAAAAALAVLRPWEKPAEPAPGTGSATAPPPPGVAPPAAPIPAPGNPPATALPGDAPPAPPGPAPAPAAPPAPADPVPAAPVPAEPVPAEPVPAEPVPAEEEEPPDVAGESAIEDVQRALDAGEHGLAARRLLEARRRFDGLRPEQRKRFAARAKWIDLMLDRVRKEGEARVAELWRRGEYEQALRNAERIQAEMGADAGEAMGRLRTTLDAVGDRGPAERETVRAARSARAKNDPLAALVASEGFEGKFEFSPDIEDVRAIRAWADAEAPVVALETDPPGAEVLLAGRASGRTPWSGRIPAGRVEAEFRLEGYHPLQRAVEVRRAEGQRFPFSLEALPPPDPVPALELIPWGKPFPLWKGTEMGDWSPGKNSWGLSDPSRKGSFDGEERSQPPAHLRGDGASLGWAGMSLGPTVRAAPGWRLEWQMLGETRRTGGTARVEMHYCLRPGGQALALGIDDQDVYLGVRDEAAGTLTRTHRLPGFAAGVRHTFTVTCHGDVFVGTVDGKRIGAVAVPADAPAEKPIRAAVEGGAGYFSDIALQRLKKPQ